jgi:Flp pilus assembly protein TadB
MREEEFVVLLFVALTVVIVCSYLSVKAWIDARRMEREAFYRTEALKKFVELQGNVSDTVLETLRHAIEEKSRPPTWRYDYNREREAYYRSETLKRIAAMPEGATAVLEYLRHDDSRAERKRGESSKLKGMVIAATGAGIMVFGLSFRGGGELLLVGFIPVLVGTVLLVHAFGIMPGPGNQGKADSGPNHE